MNEQADLSEIVDADFLHMIGELHDPTCTAWTCPYCQHGNYKYARHLYTGEIIQFDRECDECGFDARPFMPAQEIITS